ncbi:D-alanyl-D-alanine carboxypeptidase family protein [Herbivorax sp. ANBcel31]|uniref:D-alanyl-D-alanine carboxypeptidase family protein n=1 Tax=Herbivorax sp. ANBcel31 TaxID=3069754 RepID=UPI0027B2F90F|nr:D-alanyl-D-alanine carboxypeptidase family protein [Herbivorax sp. ANBcel31]MDQ2085687.1 D-alanyl-D-alanine carboxypeptidase family protein [Herbivorax sp. ANBcel31]
MTKKSIISILLGIVVLANQFMYLKGDDFDENEPLKEVVYIEGDTYSGIKPPKISAGAAVILDTVSGRILYEKNAHSRKAMASTTKIMTAIVAIENGNLDDKVKASKRAASIRGSVINLKAGEELILKELLYGLLIKSGNDAAIAIAEHVGGSVEGFAEMMNSKAKELGLKDTAFKNPHGLDANGHYSTAYELAKLARYALKNPVFSEIVGTKNTTITNRSLHTTNEMLSIYPGADGVKTGYTGKAGRCLVTSATRDNWRIISVVLNCSSRTTRAQSSKDILDFAFSNYKIYSLAEFGEIGGRVNVDRGKKEEALAVVMKDIKIPLTLPEKEKLKKIIVVKRTINAPVFEDVEVGEVKFCIDDKVIARSGLKTKNKIPKKEYGDYFNEILYVWFSLIKKVCDA